VLPVSGDAFVLDDLAASFTEPWICARAAHLWDAVRTGGCTLEAAEAVCDANLDTLSRPAVSGGRSKANRPPGHVRQWENDREELEAFVFGVDGPAFARARTEGRLLSIAEAAGLDAR
jgi:hypothetical protein